MKQINILLSIAAFLAIIFSGCNTDKPRYTINGTIDTESGVIYLQSFRNKMFFVIDSTEIENGKFQFTGTVEHPDLYGITTNRDEVFSPYYIFIENNLIDVEIEVADRRNAKINGSQSQDLYNYYLANRQSFDIDSFIAANPASVVPAYVLYRDYISRLSTEELQNSVSKFDASLNELSYIKEVKSVIGKRQQVKVGSQAPDFLSLSPEGEELSLSNFQGQYVLLQFWASWCGPCRRSNPHYVKLYDQFKDQGFHIVSVSLDNNKQAWINAIEADQLTWSHLSDLKFWDSEPASLYGVRNIPSNVLIDPQGTILGINLRGTDLDQKLAEVFM
jgi:peroxiredoxin